MHTFKVGDKVKFTSKNIALTKYEKRWMRAGNVYEVIAIQDDSLIIRLTPILDGLYSHHYFEKVYTTDAIKQALHNIETATRAKLRRGN